MNSARRTLPKRPFRDSAIFYGVLSILFVLIVWGTGGAVLPRWDGQREIGGLPIAIMFFFVATGYSWWRFRQRIEEEEEGSES